MNAVSGARLVVATFDAEPTGGGVDRDDTRGGGDSEADSGDPNNGDDSDCGGGGSAGGGAGDTTAVSPTDTEIAASAIPAATTVVPSAISSAGADTAASRPTSGVILGSGASVGNGVSVGNAGNSGGNAGSSGGGADSDVGGNWLADESDASPTATDAAASPATTSSGTHETQKFKAQRKKTHPAEALRQKSAQNGKDWCVSRQTSAPLGDGSLSCIGGGSAPIGDSGIIGIIDIIGIIGGSCPLMVGRRASWPGRGGCNMIELLRCRDCVDWSVEVASEENSGKRERERER